MFAALGKEIATRPNIVAVIEETVKHDRNNFDSFLCRIANRIEERAYYLSGRLKELNEHLKTDTTELPAHWKTHLKNMGSEIYLRWTGSSVNEIYSGTDVVVTSQGKVHLYVEITEKVWEMEHEGICPCMFNNIDWVDKLKALVRSEIGEDLEGVGLEIVTPFADFEI